MARRRRSSHQDRERSCDRAHRHHRHRRWPDVLGRLAGAAVVPVDRLPGRGATSTTTAGWGRRPGPRSTTPASGSPTAREFEDAVAALEGAEAALSFASGDGSGSPRWCWGLCSQGDRIVRLAAAVLHHLGPVRGPPPRFGIEVELVGRHRLDGAGRLRGEAHAAPVRRDAGQPPAVAGRPRCRGRHQVAHHGGRLDLRHAGRAAAPAGYRASTWRSHCGPPQGHRRPQRRPARRDRAGSAEPSSTPCGRGTR